MSSPVPYASLFTKYQDSNVLNKSELYAHWTLPQLMVDIQAVGSKSTTAVERDFQEMGALLVGNLASKLAGLLFPNSRPFYKIKPGPVILSAAKEKGITATELASGLAKLELESCQQLFLNASYEQLIFALKHLIVTGNVLLYRDSAAKKTVAYGLRSFSCRRDGKGNVIDTILREYTEFLSLEPGIQTALRAKHATRYDVPDGSESRVTVYTRIKREQRGGFFVYTVSQEADDVAVGEPGTYPEHLCPWQVPPWSLVIGENYGRGLVEDFAGGFAKLSDASHAMTLYEIAASKVVNLVAPGTGADIDSLADAETGEYVSGTKDGVIAFEGGDAKKMEQMRMSIDATFQRLARAFMYKANTRDAERVTAFELKQDALEADNALGGVFSSLSASIQTPLAHVLLTEVNDTMLEGIVSKQIKLDISAGIPALGRQADVQNLAAAAQDAGAIVPILVQLSNKIDPEKLLAIIFAGQSIDPETIFKDKERLAQEAEAAQQQAEGQQQVQQSANLSEQAEQLQGIQA